MGDMDMKYVVDKLHVLPIWLVQEMTNSIQLKITMLEEFGFIFVTLYQNMVFMSRTTCD